MPRNRAAHLYHDSYEAHHPPQPAQQLSISRVSSLLSLQQLSHKTLTELYQAPSSEAFPHDDQSATSFSFPLITLQLSAQIALPQGTLPDP